MNEVRSEVPDEVVQKAELLKSLADFVHFGQLSVHSSFILVFVGHFIRSSRGAYHFGFDRRLFACFLGFLGFLVDFWVQF
jgi:hypothetical protein